MIRIITTYRFECDWQHGCLDHLVIHGAESLVEAQRRGRAEHWTFARNERVKAAASQSVRCPRHAYMPATKRTGRPKKAA